MLVLVVVVAELRGRAMGSLQSGLCSSTVPQWCPVQVPCPASPQARPVAASHALWPCPARVQYAAFLEPKNPHVAEKLAWAKDVCAKKQHTTPSSIGGEKLYNPFLRAVFGMCLLLRLLLPLDTWQRDHGAHLSPATEFGSTVNKLH